MWILDSGGGGRDEEHVAALPGASHNVGGGRAPATATAAPRSGSGAAGAAGGVSGGRAARGPNRGSAAVAAAAEKAMRLLANVHLKDAPGQVKRPAAARSAAPAASRVAAGGGAEGKLAAHPAGRSKDGPSGGPVRYETRRSEGGALFTFAMPAAAATAPREGRTGADAGTTRDLVSGYMGSATGGAAAAVAVAAALPPAQATAVGRKPVVAAERQTSGGAQLHARRELQYSSVDVSGVRVG